MGLTIFTGHLQNQGPREKSCIFLYSVFKKTVLIFKCTVQYLRLFVTTTKFYGMNNIFGKTKKQYTTKIFTTKIQNLNIKSGVFFFI